MASVKQRDITELLTVREESGHVTFYWSRGPKKDKAPRKRSNAIKVRRFVLR